MNGGCNRDVPVEQTIHYIVKDYRRMYHEHERLTEAVASLHERLRKYESDAVHRERRIEKLWDKLEAKQTEIESLKAKLDHKDWHYTTPPPII